MILWETGNYLAKRTNSAKVLGQEILLLGISKPPSAQRICSSRAERAAPQGLLQCTDLLGQQRPLAHRPGLQKPNTMFILGPEDPVVRIINEDRESTVTAALHPTSFFQEVRVSYQ